MHDPQFYIAIGAPLILNTLMVTILMSYINAKIDGLRDGVNARLDGVDAKIDSLRSEMNARFEAQTQALLRVEGVFDARLKHLEERER